ncbi:histidine phosphatase family protein [Celerinatantimonas sp. YJH-8]|uniref:histidine phosphatase family protein n=1 Tax=Celerinatantimonas sp. YJH-8 TaxID=3228714 RepID=UPI0038CB210C
MAQLWLVRHAHPKDMDGICYGQLDVSTVAIPAIQPYYLEQMSAFPVYSSPLSRCVKLAKQLPGSYQLDPRIQEINFGQWEGQAWSQLPKDEIDAWNQDLSNYRVGSDGECYSEFRARVLQALRAWQYTHQTAIWVTHAGVIRVILAEFLGLTVIQSLRIKLDYVSLSVVSGTQYPCVEMINQRIIQESI